MLFKLQTLSLTKIANQHLEFIFVFNVFYSFASKNPLAAFQYDL